MKTRNPIIAKTINKLNRIYWFFIRPKTTGVKAFILNPENKILMVRLTYYPDTWTFPGGRVGRNEQPENAVIRECKEEVGIELDNIDFVTTLEFDHEFKKDTVYIYKANVNNSYFEIDSKEVAEANWFDLNKLPKMGKNAKRILNTL